MTQPTLHPGRPADGSGRLPRELRTYDLSEEVGDDYGLGGNDESVYQSDIPFICIDDYRTFPDKVSHLL